MMSIALERNSNRIEGSGFVHGMSCISIFESSESGRQMIGNLAGDGKFPVGNLGIKEVKKVEEREKEDGEQEKLEELDSSSSSSSIGRDSDLSNGGYLDEDGSDETEVQSSYKGPFDTMDSLEEVLPIKRGISKFYCGKSKSFTSLADASSSSSVKDFAKPENAYSRRRRNLLACSTILDKNRNCYPLRSNGGGISKRMTSSRSTLALAVAMNNSETESSNNSEYSNSPPPQTRPPLYPQSKRSLNNNIESSSSSPPQRSFSSWRSFSMADLQFAATNNITTTNSSGSTGDKHKKLH